MKSKPSTPKTKTSAPQRFERRKTGGGSALANRKAAVSKVMKDVLETEALSSRKPGRPRKLAMGGVKGSV
ncbi:hypothetical protein Bealeia2_02034 (plasmid) [Candidatus Bealeia paramacronuclearis]|uniref:hypothetical protein n=1 Tax=Candidatus Bealeia paramacronuclearis TaxID=1921001 RepID=UPI002C496060|nr:hypothetical protein [Candidatus Bealeia paramacronuclearis]